MAGIGWHCSERVHLPEERFPGKAKGEMPMDPNSASKPQSCRSHKKLGRSSIMRILARNLIVPVAALTTLLIPLCQGQTNVWTGSWSLGAPSSGQNVEIQADLAWASLGGITSFGNWTHTSGTFTWQGTAGLSMNDVILNGGAWTHQANSTTLNGKQHWINLSANSFTLNAPASIDATGRGYAAGEGPGAAAIDGYGSSAGHGGDGAQGYWGTPGNAYGSITAPDTLGSGASWAGGGAVRLTVSNAVQIDGAIRVDAFDNDAAHGGSGASIGGGGTLSANGSGDNHGRPGQGAGGRIALVQTAGDASYADLTAGGLTIEAFSGDSNICTGGAGTIYVEKAADTDGQGELVVDNGTPALGFYQLASVRGTPVSGTFSQLTVQNMGVATVNAGDTLTLPVDVVSDADDLRGGIALRGGTLTMTSGTLTIDDWTLYADAGGTQTFTGDIVVADGGRIAHTDNGPSPNTQYVPSVPHSVYRMDLTVNGNVLIQSGGAIDATRRGFGGYNSLLLGPGYSTGANGYGSGASYGGSGGQGYAGAVGPSYGSILAPALPASAAELGVIDQSGGGAIRLTVNGALTVNGGIYADTDAVGGDGTRIPGASGGSVFITADSVDGTGGAISANGDGGTHGYSGQGGGGRIAIVLTGSDTVGAGVTLAAYGGASNARVGAAGTIYIEGQGDGPGGGVITVDNNGKVNTGSPTQPFTLLPPSYDGTQSSYPFPEYGYSDDLSAATLILEDAARVALTGDLAVAAAVLGTGTLLDLAGYTLTVFSFTDPDGDAWTEGGTYGDNLSGWFDGVSFSGGSIVILTAIPEPASAALLAAAGLLSLRRRRGA